VCIVSGLYVDHHDLYCSCGDALFSFLPSGFHQFKLPCEVFFIGILIVLNLRGLKESVAILAPIFLTFIVTHAFMLAMDLNACLMDIVPIATNLGPTSVMVSQYWADGVWFSFSFELIPSAVALIQE